MKVDVERFGCNSLLQDSKFMKNVVKIAINVWWNNWRKESVYKKKDSKTNHEINFNAATMLAHIHNKKIKTTFWSQCYFAFIIRLYQPQDFQFIAFLR